MREMVVLLLFSAMAPAADLRSVCSGPLKTHTEVIDSGSHTYSVRLNGSIDGEMTRDPVGYWAFDQFWEPNVFVRLENTGEVPVINPWIQPRRRPDTRSVRSIVGALVEPSMPESERARRIWEFEIKNRFHATTSDLEVEDAVKRFNVYGYTLCGPESRVLSDLWRAAGLKTRRGYPNGHETAEAFYDGGWHLLDSDESIICLLRDNKTIASEEQIVADHELMKRTHTYGPLHDDNRPRDETSAALHYYEGERRGEHPSRAQHTMEYTLRPGESITWAWDAGKRFHNREYPGGEGDLWVKRWRLMTHVMNGELAWSPDFTRPETLKYVDARDLEVRAVGPFGRGLYPKGRSGAVEWTVKSAYPVVGGSLEVDLGRGDPRAGRLAVSLSLDGGKTWRPVWTTGPGDYARMSVDLNKFFPETDPARYEYRLRFELSSRGEQPTVCLKAAALKSTLQMARLALPGLSLGDNSFTYADQSGPGRKVKITHGWRECDTAAVPGAPADAAYPPDGGKADGTRIAFRWLPPQRGPAPEDYEFQLSEFRDMRWALSPNFHKLISRTANRGTTSFELPYLGLLNPGETYYWRVRGRSAEGVWGRWSKVFSFAAVAPAVPLNVAARFDSAARTVTLQWQAGQGGTPPARYRVYGSAERGFSPSDKPYRFSGGNAGMLDSAANLLLETKSAAISATLPPDLWRAYYRVAAVDSEGRESGSSDLGELPHPLIRTSRLPDAERSKFYQAATEVAASIGHLTSRDRNGRPYFMELSTGDELAFRLSCPLPKLSIDGRSGVISGFIPPDSAGAYDLAVTVTDQASGRSDTIKLPLKIR